MRIKKHQLREKNSWKKDISKNWPIYMLFFPTFIFLFVLNYIPMFGILMAFEDYKITKGIFGSKWVWFDNFIELFSGPEFMTALRNTIAIGLFKIIFAFIAPIVFAVLLSLLNSKRYKRMVQTFSYMPNFVAAVVVCSLLTEFLGPDGPLTILLANLGAGETGTNWLANSNIPVFWIIYTLMGIWQGIGWGSIMYVASIATVNGDLHEAAAIDGAGRLQRMFKITIPCIMPMIIMMFVLNVGLSFTTGFDSVLLLYMPSTYEVADTVYSYTYRLAGFANGTADYGLSAASGLFQSVVGTVLIVGSNWLSRKLTETSLF